MWQMFDQSGLPRGLRQGGQAVPGGHWGRRRSEENSWGDLGHIQVREIRDKHDAHDDGKHGAHDDHDQEIYVHDQLSVLLNMIIGFGSYCWFNNLGMIIVWILMVFVRHWIKIGK